MVSIVEAVARCGCSDDVMRTGCDCYRAARLFGKRTCSPLAGKKGNTDTWATQGAKGRQGVPMFRCPNALGFWHSGLQESRYRRDERGRSVVNVAVVNKILLVHIIPITLRNSEIGFWQRASPLDGLRWSAGEGICRAGHSVQYGTGVVRGYFSKLPTNQQCASRLAFGF